MPDYNDMMRREHDPEYAMDTPPMSALEAYNEELEGLRGHPSQQIEDNPDIMHIVKHMDDALTVAECGDNTSTTFLTTLYEMQGECPTCANKMVQQEHEAELHQLGPDKLTLAIHVTLGKSIIVEAIETNWGGGAEIIVRKPLGTFPLPFEGVTLDEIQVTNLPNARILIIPD